MEEGEGAEGFAGGGVVGFFGESGHFVEEDAEGVDVGGGGVGGVGEDFGGEVEEFGFEGDVQLPLPILLKRNISMTPHLQHSTPDNHMRTRHIPMHTPLIMRLLKCQQKHSKIRE